MPLTASDQGNTDDSRPAFAQKGNTYFPIRDILPTADNNFGTTKQFQYFGLATPYHEIDIAGTLDYARFDPFHLSVFGEFVKNVAFDHGSINAIAINNRGPDRAGGQAREFRGRGHRLDRRHQGGNARVRKTVGLVRRRQLPVRGIGRHGRWIQRFRFRPGWNEPEGLHALRSRRFIEARQLLSALDERERGRRPDVSKRHLPIRLQREILMKAIRPVVLCLLLLAPGVSRADDAKVKETLRTLTLRLRTAETEQASLQAEKAQLEQDKKALAEKTDLLTKEAASDKATIANLTSKAAEQETTINQTKDSLAKWKAAYEQINAAAQKLKAERDKAVSEDIIAKRDGC